MQFELLAVVRLARANVAASFTLPLSELIILIRAGIPSVKENKYMKHRFPLHYHCQNLSFLSELAYPLSKRTNIGNIDFLYVTIVRAYHSYQSWHTLCEREHI